MITISVAVLFSVVSGVMVGWKYRPWDMEEKAILIEGMARMAAHILIVLAVLHYIIENMP